MQDRPLTVEEYVVAGISLRHCMKCGEDMPPSAPRDWLCYYRKDGLPRVMCTHCFDRELERGGVVAAAYFASPEAAATNDLKGAHEVPGLPQKTPEQVERAFAEFRSLSPDEIQKMSVEIPCRAKIGDCLETFGPISWGLIMRCLEWLRESCDVRLPFVFKRWEKWPAILEKNVGEPKYEVWKARLATMAEGEFSFRYNVLLSDSIQTAQNKADAKQAPEAKIKILNECKATVCKYPPPASFPGGGEDYRRFIEYIDTTIARLAPVDDRPAS
jgi:hypothetical protein